MQLIGFQKTGDRVFVLPCVSKAQAFVEIYLPVILLELQAFVKHFYRLLVLAQQV